MPLALTQSSAWKALQAHRATFDRVTLNDLFAQEAHRAQRWTLRVEGLSVDFSCNHMTQETVALFEALAREQAFERWRARMFSGEKINQTENRAVLHTALRAKDRSPIVVDGQDVMPQIRAAQDSMRAIVEGVRSGQWLGFTGKRIANVVNIGIGGSDLGPRLVVKALGAFASGPRAHFVANADASELADLLPLLDPATTMFVVVSKTFTTQETQLNAKTARQWLVAALGEVAVARHFVAVSVNQEAMAAFGVPDEHRLPMWDWVGGRFSVWSCVGLSVALSLGWEAFVALLDGAAAMDAHFRTAPLAQNVPFLLASRGVWYRNFWNCAGSAVLPYSERLRSLPRFLQQLEMESNGKSVDRQGQSVDYATAPIVFGDCGTVSQHSFHQWLHQGTDLTPADFIGLREDGNPWPEHHRALVVNLLGQRQALCEGVAAETPHRTNPGNRPSVTMWMDRLNPQNLGTLVAMYEHKVFTQGVFWNINAFDQWGVELGKQLAQQQMAQQQITQWVAGDLGSANAGPCA